MDPQQYASLEPMDSDHLMEKVAEFQRHIDGEQATLDDLKRDAKECKARIERWQEKLAVVGRARDSGQAVFQLRGGELTTEKPTIDGNLPFKDPVEETPQPSDDAEEVDAQDGTEEEAYDKDSTWEAQHEGETIEVRMEADGKWYGRLGGKPIALHMDTPAKARATCATYVDAELEWEAYTYAPEDAGDGTEEGVEPEDSVELGEYDDVEEVTPQPAGDLTNGL